MTKPKLLLLDEPAAGLTQEIHTLMGGFQRVGGNLGTLIEHRMEVVGNLELGICLNHGKVAEGVRVIKEDPAVIQAYLGKGGK